MTGGSAPSTPPSFSGGVQIPNTHARSSSPTALPSSTFQTLPSPTKSSSDVKSSGSSPIARSSSEKERALYPQRVIITSMCHRTQNFPRISACMWLTWYSLPRHSLSRPVWYSSSIPPMGCERSAHSWTRRVLASCFLH